MQVDSEDEEVMDLRSIEAITFAPQGVNSISSVTDGADGSLKIWDLSYEAQCHQTCIISKDSERDTNNPGENVGAITQFSWHPFLPLIFASSLTQIAYWKLWCLPSIHKCPHPSGNVYHHNHQRDPSRFCHE